MLEAEALESRGGGNATSRSLKRGLACLSSASAGFLFRREEESRSDLSRTTLEMRSNSAHMLSILRTAPLLSSVHSIVRN